MANTTDDEGSGLGVASYATPPPAQQQHQQRDPAQVVAFSLTPATSIGGVIDYRTGRGRKLYATATAKLEDEPFDCVAEDLYSFLKALKDRAREFGWDEQGVGILSIPDDPVNPNDFKSLIDQHGEIELSTIRAFEESYIDQAIRPAQDTAQLYRCLMASISKEGKKKILIWESQYTINGLGSGNLLLKIIVRESHLDTNATSASIRTKLTDLDRYLPTIGNDITKFNTYVKLLIDGLRSRGETSHDLLVNLFKGYMACSDREFVAYIKRKQDLFEEGTPIQVDHLMNNAADKYKTLLQKGKWNAPDANEAKIMALRAEIKKLKRGNDGRKEKVKTSLKKFQKKDLNEKPKWFTKRPSNDSLHKTKEWKGKQWYYCHPDTGGKCNGVWRQHKPSECKGNEYRFKTNPTKESNPKRKDESTNNSMSKKKRTMKLERALQAAQATAEPDEDEMSTSESDE